MRNALAPGDPVTAGQLRRAGNPTLRLLAWADGSAAGCGLATRSAVLDAAFVGIWVPAEWRRRGIGSALLDTLSDHARGLGVSILRTRAAEAEEDALAFLGHRGFVEVTRECESALDVRAAGEPPAAVPPEGIAIVSLRQRPDLAAQAYALSIEGYADIPSAEDISAGSFDEWRRENVEQAILDGSFLAVAGERVVGSAGLAPSGTGPGVAEHLLTVVGRGWRRRGIARALKLAQIRWARGAGCRELLTFNDAGNVPMRRLNEELGYRVRTVVITLHGPLGGARS